MHLIQLKIHKFLQDIQSKPYSIPEDLLAKFGNETRLALKKQFEREPRPFKISMSNAGKPLCTLQMEKEYGRETGDIIRFTFGDLVEDIILFLIYASGLKVVSEQEHVTLVLGEHTLNGTLDIVLDLGNGFEVYDIKSASDYSFKSKKEQSFEDFVASDIFGYVGQLFGYAKAKGYKPGGFIFCNKSSGEIYILEVPKEHSRFETEALAKMEYNLKHIGSPFKRSFSDVEETFKKKKTGNRILGFNCSMCDYKFKCWPEVQLRSQQDSTSKTPKMMYYTKVNESN